MMCGEHVMSEKGYLRAANCGWLFEHFGSVLVKIIDGSFKYVFGLKYLK